MRNRSARPIPRALSTLPAPATPATGAARSQQAATAAAPRTTAKAHAQQHPERYTGHYIPTLDFVILQKLLYSRQTITLSIKVLSIYKLFQSLFQSRRSVHKKPLSIKTLFQSRHCSNQNTLLIKTFFQSRRCSNQNTLFN